MTLVSGPAGTGKTFIACGIASRLFKEHKIEHIVLTRPLVTCGSGIGFLPGNVEEKVGPYMLPLLDAFGEFFSNSELHRLLKEKQIEMIPMELMRGASFKNSFIICDEAQNCSLEQLRMFMTRLDLGSKMVVTGDGTQSDLANTPVNAFVDVIKRFTPQCHPDIAIVKLSREDVCRDPLINWMDERLMADKVVISF